MVTKATPVIDTPTQDTEFDLEGWLKAGIKGLRRTVKCRPAMVPEEFRLHTRAARKEMLLAVRSLVDSAIQELEQTAEPARR
jgi:hypothetical protein